MCRENYSVYAVHPADNSLTGFYRGLGMKECSYRYFTSVEGDGGAFCDVSPREYSFMGEMYSRGADPQWLTAGGYRLVGFELDGIECAACLSDGVIWEVLAPPHLEGRAARRCASVYGTARLALQCDSPIGAETALMTYNGHFNDFRLFGE
jgi:hypothetical protein